MLKKLITYKDFNDEEVTEEYFFHLSKAELIELEMSKKDGLSVVMQRIIDTNDGAAIIKEFKTIILLAYGQRSPDGKRFVKTQALRDEFESSEAYSTLFVELCTDADAAVAFMNGIIPKDLDEEVEKITARQATRETVKLVEAETMSLKDFVELPIERVPEVQAQIAAGTLRIEQ